MPRAAKVDIRQEYNPADIADTLEYACLSAEIANGGNPKGVTLRLDTEVIGVIAKLLRLVPPLKGRPPLTNRQRSYTDALIQKTRMHKTELVGQGMPALIAEDIAVKHTSKADAYKRSAETFRRALRTKRKGDK